MPRLVSLQTMSIVSAVFAVVSILPDFFTEGSVQYPEKMKKYSQYCYTLQNVIPDSLVTLNMLHFQEAEYNLGTWLLLCHLVICAQ